MPRRAASNRIILSKANHKNRGNIRRRRAFEPDAEGKSGETLCIAVLIAAQS
jgi:hypothetical protein